MLQSVKTRTVLRIAISYILLVLITFLVLLPIITMLSTSLKSSQAVYGEPGLIPDNASLDRYRIPMAVTTGETILHEQDAIVDVSRPNMTLDIQDDRGAPGERVTVQYTLQNQETSFIQDVEMDVGRLPGDWSIIDATVSGGSPAVWNGTNTTAAGTVSPIGRFGDEIQLTMELRIPRDAAAREYEIPVAVRVGDLTLYRRSALVTVDS